VVDAVDLFPQFPDTSSGSIPDGDAAVLGLFVPTPRLSNNQIWAQPPARRPADGAMLLSFIGFPFASHRILAAASLNPPGWTNLAAVLADGLGVVSFADSNAPAAQQRFYRAASP
jgi:hypothetical protein